MKLVGFDSDKNNCFLNLFINNVLAVGNHVLSTEMANTFPERSEMKICITSEGMTLDSTVDPRFGRCRYFIIFDTGDENFECIENKNAELTGGAGIQSAQLVCSKGIKSVLTGNIGPNAFKTLTAAGVSIYTGVSGTVKEVIDEFLSGKIKITSNPTVNVKSGV